MLSRLLWHVRRLLGARYGLLSIGEAASAVGRPGVYFFDVNAPARYARGHLPGAKNLAPDKVGATDLPPDKEATLVFYCGGPL
jgi:rhodanese-related sulfurtransferase